jgi:DNA invertase Pin-like site-specific DNA recombinase
MSAHRRASSGSCSVGIRSSRATSQGVQVAQRKRREQPTRVALTDAISVDRADRHGAMVGYASADADQRARANDELRRQVEEIASECERRGLCLLEVVRERDREHRRPLERPGLGYALEQIAAGNASGLVVSDLSRVTHSLPDLGRVLEWLAHSEARFVAVGPGLDTEEEAGRLALRAVIEVSRWERERLAERTRSGMRAARRKGPASVADDPELSERIAGMRGAGMTLQAIADQLNADGIPTVRGGAKWRPSSVQAAAGYRRPPTCHALDPAPGDRKYPDGAAEEV